MDHISQIDRLVVVLRQRLLERAKTATSGRRNSAQDAKATGLDNLKALAAIEAVSDYQLRRSLTQNNLADQFGHGLVNETNFQQVVERVTEARESDDSGLALINRLVEELRNTSR